MWLGGTRFRTLGGKGNFVVLRILNDDGHIYEIVQADGCGDPKIVNRVSIHPLNFPENEPRSELIQTPYTLDFVKK